MPFWKRQKRWTEVEHDLISTLATYNSEVARGIVHTEKWKAHMVKLQERFDRLTAEDHPATW